MPLHRLQASPDDLPVPIVRKACETKMVGTPRTVVKQIPVEACTKVPVVVHCPVPVEPSPPVRKGW